MHICAYICVRRMRVRILIKEKNNFFLPSLSLPLSPFHFKANRPINDARFNNEGNNIGWAIIFERVYFKRLFTRFPSRSLETIAKYYINTVIIVVFINRLKLMQSRINFSFYIRADLASSTSNS